MCGFQAPMFWFRDCTCNAVDASATGLGVQSEAFSLKPSATQQTSLPASTAQLLFRHGNYHIRDRKLLDRGTMEEAGKARSQLQKARGSSSESDAKSYSRSSKL